MAPAGSCETTSKNRDLARSSCDRTCRALKRCRGRTSAVEHWKGARFRRQHPIGPYIADFACIAARLVVEVDGATHWTNEQLAHDVRRTKYLEQQDWTVIRVNNTDVYENTDGVWRAIAARLASSSRLARAED